LILRVHDFSSKRSEITSASGFHTVHCETWRFERRYQ
jgi:hypothetical protein